MRKKNKLVYGIGENDAGHVVDVRASAEVKKKSFLTYPFYETWRRMLRRCYSAKCQERWPTYFGCSVAPEWHKFSAFRDWMLTQPWEGNELDKDILKLGNKVYAPDTCVFVSAKLNSFMLDSCASRGQHPVGVDWNKEKGKFMARCNSPFTGKREYLGYFTEPAEAHEAWRKRKHEHACRYADMQDDPRIAQALRARYAPVEAN